MAGFDADRLAEILRSHGQGDGPLLPLLHAVQHAFGHVPDAAVPEIAKALNLSRAEVHGVVTFYADFRRAPPPPHVLRLCRAEACQARGSDQTAAQVEAALNVGLGGTSADGQVRVEPVYCLGLCASGPAALLNDQPLARLTGSRLERLLTGLAG